MITKYERMMGCGNRPETILLIIAVGIMFWVIWQIPTREECIRDYVKTQQEKSK